MNKASGFSTIAALVTLGVLSVTTGMVSQGKFSAPTATVAPVKSSLKIYRNSELGITLKYSESWRTEVQSASSGPIVNFYPQKPEAFMTYLAISYDTRSWKSINEIKEFYARTGTYTVEQMKIGGLTAYAFIRKDLPASREIYLFRETKVYNIVAEYGIPEGRMMVNSIQFTGSTPPIIKNAKPIVSITGTRTCISSSPYTTDCGMGLKAVGGKLYLLKNLNWDKYGSGASPIKVQGILLSNTTNNPSIEGIIDVSSISF